LAASGTKDSPASSRTWRSSIDGWKDEVEVLEGALKGEMRESRPGDQVPLPPGSHFDAEQVGKEVSVGQLALGRGLEPGFQHLSGLSEPELRQVLVRLRQGNQDGPPTSAS